MATAALRTGLKPAPIGPVAAGKAARVREVASAERCQSARRESAQDVVFERGGEGRVAKTHGGRQERKSPDKVQKAGFHQIPAA